MIQVIDGEIKQIGLPKVGTLKTGETISGYHLLDKETLKNEGWLPLEDIEPEYDVETQYLISDGYEILKTKVIKKYKIELIPEMEEPIDYETRITELENIIDILVGGENE